MKQFLSFFLTLTILFSGHGIIYKASKAEPTEGWHCGMELCMCAHHDHGSHEETKSDPTQNVYDSFYGSSSSQNTAVFTSSENEKLPRLEFERKIKSLSLFERGELKAQNEPRFFSQRQLVSTLFSSDITKPPQQ